RVLSIVSSKQISKTNGEPEVREEGPETKLTQFWTPSVDTKTDLANNFAPNQIPQDDSWEILNDDSRVEEFEKELWTRFKRENSGPLYGLRRYQTAGRGRTLHKRGWWWILTVKRDFDSKELAKFYFAFWNNSKQMYVEEINGKSSYE